MVINVSIMTPILVTYESEPRGCLAIDNSYTSPDHGFARQSESARFARIGANRRRPVSVIRLDPPSARESTGSASLRLDSPGPTRSTSPRPMAPKKAASEDIGWQHGTAIGSRHNYKCNYCGHTGQGGGVSRLKKHLAGGRLAGYQDVQGCKSVSAEVKRLMIEHLKGVRAESQRKKVDKGMQERIISGRQRDEDDDDEPDVPLIPEQIGSFEVGSGSGGSVSRVGGETQSRGAIVDDDAEFERLMNLGPSAHSEFMREAQAIVSAEPRRKGSHKEPAALSQAAKGKAVATSQPKKRKGKDIGPAGGPAKGIVITEPTAPAQKKKSWLPWGSKKGKKLAAPSVDPLDIADLETLDPNAEETPPEDSPRLPNSRSHDSMTTGSPGGSVGGGDGDGGGGDGNVGEGGGGGGNDGDGGAFTAEQHHGGPVKYNRRRRVRGGGRAEGAAVDSDSYNTMISDFERMSTNESVGSYGYGGHSYQPESDTGYSSGYSGYSGYATTGYPAPYFHPPPFVHVHVPILVPVQQTYVSTEDVEIARLSIVRPGCEVWDHFVREFRSRYNTMMTWDEFRSFVSRTKSYHLIGELPSESDESVQPQWGTYDPYQQGYWGY
ncbi:hypothetical protein Taro_032285 [Colocasia esculenta]|uniref:BED-type domain-containing protein n=1 Tax=Colocasia esculenta TaxID=4460 RepID=A0A843VR04_COLES|nr:hypothetical protein [Colocasia esculenta]